jgi:hypothetical protein
MFHRWIALRKLRVEVLASLGEVRTTEGFVEAH